MGNTIYYGGGITLSSKYMNLWKGSSSKFNNPKPEMNGGNCVNFRYRVSSSYNNYLVFCPIDT